MKQDSFEHHCFDIEGSGFLQTPDVFIDSPGITFFNIAGEQ